MSDGMYRWTSKESMAISYSVGESIAQRVIDLIDRELKKIAPRPDKLRDLSECLRNCLAITGSETAEDERDAKEKQASKDIEAPELEE
jgi:hypothetical protein